MIFTKSYLTNVILIPKGTGEESQINFRLIFPSANEQRCFAKPVLSEVEGLNMTALFTG
jgi:hypothetical protein